jgi:chromosome transmission fidelity protein 1
MMDGNTLMERVGGGSDQVNLMEMVAYLKESKLARKVSGFAENQAEVAMKNGKYMFALASSCILELSLQNLNRHEQRLQNTLQ